METMESTRWQLFLSFVDIIPSRFYVSRVHEYCRKLTTTRQCNFRDEFRVQRSSQNSHQFKINWCCSPQPVHYGQCMLNSSSKCNFRDNFRNVWDHVHIYLWSTTLCKTVKSSILSRAICRGAPQIQWREDCAMEMANNGWGSLQPGRLYQT